LLIELLFYLLLGVLAGVAAGLLPGLHVNSIGVIMFSMAASVGMGNLGLAVFLTSMATTQTFIDFIPSIFLGVPDEDTVLSILPAHRLLLEGRGMEAVRITGIASLYGSIISLLLLPLAFFLVPIAYTNVRAAIIPILLAIMGYLILRERGFENKVWALLVFLLSGYMGSTALELTYLSTSQVFLPMFSGLFGLSTLVMGLKTDSRSYKQDLNVEVEVGQKCLWKNSFLGTIGGFLVGLLPAMSPSQIGVILQELAALRERSGELLENVRIREFLTTVASLNTADAMFSIFGLYLMNNPRSGISVIIQDIFGQIDLSMLLLLCGVMLISSLVAYRLHIWLGMLFSKFSNRINLRALSAFGIVFVLCMVFLMTGAWGMLLAFICMGIGLLPVLTGVSRTHCMGSLIVPTLMFYLGF
jgi:putative membrane protein